MDYELAVTIRQKKLGVLLRDARIASGKYKKDCGEVIGVSSSSITSIEQGRRSPSLPELEHLAYYLQIPLSHFWEEDIRSEELLPPGAANPEVDLAIRDHVIGRMLRKAREKQDLTYKEIKRQTGITAGRMRRFEDGETPVPLPELELLCQLYEMDPMDLVSNSTTTGRWILEQRSISSIKHLSPELQQFIARPINRPYLELAYKISTMSSERMREVAETLLEIAI